MKKSNKKKIETLLLYCSRSDVAGMLNQPLLTFVTKLSDWSFTPDDEKIISNIQPLKQIVLILSGQFMKEHPRAGEPTQFREKILSGLDRDDELVATCFQKPPKKLHTIRADFKEWEAKIEKVNRGEAFLRVVTWAGVPYNSKWVDVAVLTSDDNIGVQKIQLDTRNIGVFPAIVTKTDGSTVQLDPPYIAKNDGLSMTDMVAWFAEYDLSKPLAIIHFTKFRY